MIVRSIAIALLLIGAGGFFLPFMIEPLGGEFAAVELPLTEITDVAVSADNQMFFALMFAGRIQPR